MASLEGRPNPHSRIQHDIDQSLQRIDQGERKLRYREAYEAELWPLRKEEEHLKIDLKVAEAALDAARARAEAQSVVDPTHAAREAARAYIAESKGEQYVPQPATPIATPELSAAEAAVSTVRERLAARRAELNEKDQRLRARFGLTPDD